MVVPQGPLKEVATSSVVGGAAGIITVAAAVTKTAGAIGATGATGIMGATGAVGAIIASYSSIKSLIYNSESGIRLSLLVGG